MHLQIADDLGPQVSYPAFEAGDEVLQEVQQLVTTGVPAGPPAQWAGLWRVSYAPHIRTLGNLPWAYLMLVRFGWFGQSFGLVLSAMSGGFSLFYSCFEVLSAFSPVSARKEIKKT